MNELKRIILENLGIYALIFLIMLLFGVYCFAYVFSQTDLLVIIAEEQYRDSLRAAYSLGRLDLITAVMAVVTVLVGVLSLIGYERVKIKSEETARLAAKEYIEGWMADNATEEIFRWLDQFGHDFMKETVADNISKNLEPMDIDNNG